MITELRSRGYSVFVDKPEKIISKKDLGKLFQEAADTDQDELDFYSQLVSAGITVRDVFEYAGPEQADTMFRFCYDHGLLNEDRETEYVFRMICNLLSINESHSKYGFKLMAKLTVRVKSRQRFCQNFLRILDLMLCQCSKIRMILGNYMKNGS